jgi:acetyl esterase/lipase
MKPIHFALFPILALITPGGMQGVEPLVASEGVGISVAGRRLLQRSDTDNDGVITSVEMGDGWKRYAKLDTDRDKVLTKDELKKMPLTYVSSRGKQLRNVVYKKVGAKALLLDFYFPEVDDSRHKPVVVYTHGGGWAAGSKHGAGNASFDDVHTALLRKGFCVAAVNYRLVKKDGDSAMRDCVIDAKDAIRFLVAHREALGIDPSRFFTFGDSAGGHLSQMLLLSPADSFPGDPDLAKFSYETVAGVSWYGPCDFEKVSLFNHNDRPDFRDRFGARILKPGTNPEEKSALYREMSPIQYLSAESPPLLMIQGDQDTTIPVKHAHYMKEKAAAAGAPVETLIVKNAGHNWRKVGADIEPSRDDIIKRTVGFFTGFLK